MTKHPDGERIITMIFGTEYDFWRSEARGQLTATAQSLADHYVPDDVAEAVISRVWSTASGEFGG